MPALEPLAAPAPRRRHGPGARVAMVAFGLLVVLAFGSLGGLLGVEAFRTGPVGQALVAAFLLALAAYGGWLAWRGLRGWSRATPGTHRLLLGVGALLLAGGLAGLAMAVVDVLAQDPVWLQRAPWWSAAGGAWRMVMFGLALPLQVAVHELGHVLAGRRVGFDFVELQVGLLRLHREAGRWRVAWGVPQLGLAGHATMLYPHTGRLAQRQAIFAAGGPAANLAAALVAGLAAAALPADTAVAARCAGLLEGCVAAGIVMGVLNLVPMPFSASDGARIWQGLRARR